MAGVFFNDKPTLRGSLKEGNEKEERWRSVEEHSSGNHPPHRSCRKETTTQLNYII